MKRLKVFSMCVVGVAMLIAGPGFAAGPTDRAPDTSALTNPLKGADEAPPRSFGGRAPIPDNAYDGSLGSMVCLSTAGPSVNITDLDVQVAISHTWAGDLVIKLVSPSNEILTLMSRPGLAEPADDGTDCCGNSADMNMAFPITFNDAAGTSAENLGDPGTVVCEVDGICNYAPAPDTGPGTNLAQYNGQNAAGTWQVCVGDAGGGDTGDFDSFSLVFNGLSSDLDLTMTAPDGVGLGGPTTLSMDLTNLGPSPQSGAAVSGMIPAEMNYVSDTCGGSMGGSTWTWPVGSMASGAATQCDLILQMNTPACSAVSMTMTATGVESDPVSANNTATVTNSGEAVADGSFEDGTPNSFWAEASTNFGTPLCTVADCGTGTGTGPLTGDWWTWFGGISAAETGSVTQTVTIPVGASLTFYVEAILCDSPADFVQATIDGTEVWRLDGSSALCGALGYTQQTVSLVGFDDNGSHTLEFRSQIFANNGGGSNFFIDDVSIPSVICTDGGVQPTPDAIPTLGALGIALLIGILIGSAIVILRPRS